jgi:hypothetical protein
LTFPEKTIIMTSNKVKSGCRKTRKSQITGRKIVTKDCARRRVSERNRRFAAAFSAEITQEGVSFVHNHKFFRAF